MTSLEYLVTAEICNVLYELGFEGFVELRMIL